MRGSEPTANTADAVRLEAGRAALRIERVGGRSVASRAFATSPLRVLTPRNHGSAAWLYLGSYGGGLLDGDRLRVDVEVGPDADALVCTQAWTKVYRSVAQRGSPNDEMRPGATFGLDAAVARGGRLLLLPDPVVCFESARYEQTQRIDLEPGAGLVLLDWFTSGRRASGERWRFDRYASRLSIRSDGRLVLFDACVLTPDAGELPERFGRFNVVCLLAIVGEPFAVAAARALDWVRRRPVDRRPRMLAGASPLTGAGALVRFAGESYEEVAAAVRDVLHFVPRVLGDNPWERKW